MTGPIVYCHFTPTEDRQVYGCDQCGNRTRPTPHGAEQIRAVCRASTEYHDRLVRGLACRHRGAQSGQLEPAGCGCAGRLLPLFGCAVYGACTLAANQTTGRGRVACCLGCPQREDPC